MTLVIRHYIEAYRFESLEICHSELNLFLIHRIDDGFD